MLGIRFYADLPGTSWFDENNLPVEHMPPRTTIRELREYAKLGRKVNCLALLLGKEHQGGDFSQECLSSVFAHPDSDVNLCSISRAYLRGCRRIPEALARELHPRLAVRLDSE